MKVAWESVPVTAAQTVRFLSLSMHALAGALHAHEMIEITWVEQGRGLRFVSDSVEPFGPGDLVLVAPRVAHTWLSSGPQPEGVRIKVMQLRPSAELIALPEWRHGIGALLAQPTAAWVMQGALAEAVCSQMQELDQLEGLQQLGAALAVLGRIARAGHQAKTLRPIGLQVSPPRGGAGQASERRVHSLLRWIRNHSQAELPASEAARLLHVTPAAFSRAFKRMVGKPFTEYVNDLRVAEACLLLRQSDRPVGEIAQRCGFPTLSNFNVQFRLRTSHTPRDYRRLIGSPPK